jgi:hypothetical protein
MPHEWSERAQQWSFRRWWGIGGGVAGIIVSLVTSSCQGPSNDSVTVSAAGPGFSNTTLFVMLLAGCAVAMHGATYMSLSKFNAAARTRSRFAALWAVVVLLIAASNVYLAYYPGPEWLYTSVTMHPTGPVAVRTLTSHRNPFLMHLLMTFPLAGAFGGLGGGMLLRPVWWRTAGMTVMWALAFAVGAVLAWVSNYLFYAGMIDVFEAAHLGARLGQIVGAFAAGFLTAYVVATIGSVFTLSSLRSVAAR